jgi:hypothetical protein
LTGEADVPDRARPRGSPPSGTPGVGSKRDISKPELVDRTAEVLGISASGDLTAIYPANFRPSQIVHDVPLPLER